MPVMKNASPSQDAVVSQFSRPSASGASEPPLVTEKAMINAITTPTRLSPTIKPAENKVPIVIYLVTILSMQENLHEMYKIVHER